MKYFKNIDIAFLSLYQPFTKTVDEAVKSAIRLQHRILYPYHLTVTDKSLLVKKLSLVNGVEVIMRSLS